MLFPGRSRRSGFKSSLNHVQLRIYQGLKATSVCVFPILAAIPLNANAILDFFQCRGQLNVNAPLLAALELLLEFVDIGGALVIRQWPLATGPWSLVIGHCPRLSAVVTPC